jgi:hypothetical protein
MLRKGSGAASIADCAQIPALHEGRGMVAGLQTNVRRAYRFPA